MLQANNAKIRLVAVTMGLAMLAGCVTPPPPPPPAPPPPPPPVVKLIPPRPVPPGGAVPSMYVPPRDAYGIRQTVNYGLSSQQTIWNLRSALNVAALNCQDPQYADLIPAYRALLDNNKRELARVNDRITSDYRANYGRTYRDEFDGYMTQVYNYFALPNAQAPFCDMALEVSYASMSMEPGALESFAIANLPRLEGVFDQFYAALEQYRIDVAAWDAEYAPPPPVYTSSFVQSSDYAAQTAPAGVTGAYIAPAAPEIIAVPVDPSDAADVDPVNGTSAEIAPTGPAPTPGFTTNGPIVFVSEPVVEPIKQEDAGGEE